MEQYIQSAALVLLTSVLGLVLAQKGKEFTLLLTLGACCLVGLVAMQYLEPVLNFAERFKALAGMDHELLEVLLKVVGISLVAELASMICTDAGNAALGKVLQMLSTAVILCMSIPLLDKLLELISSILGGI